MNDSFDHNRSNGFASLNQDEPGATKDTSVSRNAVSNDHFGENYDSGRNAEHSFFDFPETVGGDDDPLKPDPITPMYRDGASPLSDPMPERTPGQGKHGKEKRKNGKTEPAAGASPKACRPPTGRALIFPALGFLFPLAYLFFDLFAFLGTVLEKTDGISGAARFVALATDSAFSTNSAGELLGAVFGNGNPVTLLSLKNLSAAEFRLPLAVTMICALLCVAAGACLLMFGKKVICSRILTDLTVAVGLLGAFAPFVGKLAYLLASYGKGGFSAMERASAELIVSADALLIALICCAFLLASVASVRRLSASARGAVVYTPLLCDRAGADFPLAKVLTVVFLLFCLGIGCLFFVGNVYLPDYHFSDWGGADLLNKTGELLRGLMNGGEGNDMFLQALSLLADVFFAIQLPVLVIGVAVLVFRILAVIFTPKSWAKKRKNLRKEGKKTASTARNLLLVPFWYCLAYQILATCLILGEMGGHLDFANPPEVMTLFYLAVAKARSLFCAGGAYAVLVGVGAVFWHLAAGLHNAMILRQSEAAKKGTV